jgi:Flp pilus assembly protein TadB
MKYCYLFALFFVLSLSQLEAAVPYASVPKETVVEEKTDQKNKQLTQFKERIKNISAKQKVKMDERLNKLNKKLVAAEAGERGIKVGLILIGIGAVLGILGFLAGLGNLLVTIGGVILVVGLILWLFDAL